jgi:putative ABC transport system permease protein
VIAAAMVLAVVATFFAASRPARAITRVPVVTALAGRPAQPRQIRRSALPGVVLIVIAALLFAYTGTRSGGGAPELVLGFVALIAAVVLLAPFGLSVLARLGRRAPVAVRLALRDLARYRARSGSALAAISLGVLIAVLVCVLSAARYRNVLDYTGPNLAANQLIVYTPSGGNGPGIGGKGGPGGNGGPATGGSLQSMAAQARGIAAALGSRDIVTLDSPNASLQHAAAGRMWGGAIYVATPQLLQSFGIKASQVNPAADVLSARPGLSGITKMQVIYGNYGSGGGLPGGGNGNSYPCPVTSCLANPVIQEVGALPSGTSAPNTLITEHAIRQLGLQVSVAGWLIQTAHPLTPAQVHDARLTASAAGLNIETKSSLPSLAEILNVATAFGTLLALAILAMSVGLIRSETASDLRTLAATGASSSTRRTLTAATAGALALLGAVLGTVAAYIAAIAYTSNNSLDGLSGLSSIPVANLLVILVGMPLAAVIVGWLLAGREPPAITHQPIE